MGLIICLDPGHVKGYNRGAYSDYYEGTKMYDLAVMLKEELEKYDDITVYITRTLNENPSLAQRGAFAKRKNARLFISLHTNASSSEATNSVVIYRSIQMPETDSLANRLMNKIVEVVNKDVPTRPWHAGILTRTLSNGLDYYGVLRGSTGGSIKEAMIIEHVFHTNYKQSEWMYCNDNIRKIAEAEAEVIAKYYGHEKKITLTKPSPSKNNNTTPTVSKPVQVTESTSKDHYVKYAVKKGDTWWKISKEQLGSGTYMKYLASYNNKTILSVIHINDIIKIPVNLISKKYKTYTVIKGDSWWGIAKKEMNKGSKYKELASFNNMSTDDAIRPGMIIKIPIQ